MKEKENWNEKEWEGVKGGGDNGSKSGAAGCTSGPRSE